MFPIETSKANLKKIDYDILDFLEYPKSLEEIRNAFPNINVTVKVLEFLDKNLIEEKKENYVSRFHTPQVKNIINNSRMPEKIKKNFHFFLSQIDNPFVRENILDSESREKSEFIFSMMTHSINRELTHNESKQIKNYMDYLMNKLR
jgi:hypothetical protein